MSADSLIQSSLYLFNGLPVQDKSNTEFPYPTLLYATVKRGFLFSPEILGNYKIGTLAALVDQIGVSGEEANSSFHKSWEKIATASILQLVVEQIIHYFTTYGVEMLTGEEHPEMVYIPLENLEIPDLPKLELKIIHGYTLEELKQKTLGLLNSGIALKDKTLEAVLEILSVTKITPEEVSLIKNREFLVILYDTFKILPRDPEEFLRYLVYKTIGATMLIKDRKTFSEIQAKKGKQSDVLLLTYAGEYGAEKLAEIFYRYKPIFLAFKQPSVRTLINRVRKLAPEYNMPAQPQFLDILSSKRFTKENVQIAQQFLSKITVWRKMRIAMALNYRISGGESIVYKIRNGKLFSTAFKQNNPKDVEQFLGLVLYSLAKDIAPKISGKRIFIPHNVTYGLPVSEKQFVGNVPAGTSVTVDKDLIIGIWWKNTKRRIDLDFSLNTLGGKFGWDSAYRNSGRSVLFSGDMTDASGKGASELFYITPAFNDAALSAVNYFNHMEGDPVPARFFLAKESLTNLPKSYMVNPANILCSMDFEVKDKQTVFGFVKKGSDGSLSFYFMEGTQGNSITSKNTKYMANSVQYLTDYFETMISLNQILTMAGAELTTTPENVDFDLSLENLEKDTILNMFK